MAADPARGPEGVRPGRDGVSPSRPGSQREAGAYPGRGSHPCQAGGCAPSVPRRPWRTPPRYESKPAPAHRPSQALDEALTELRFAVERVAEPETCPHLPRHIREALTALARAWKRAADLAGLRQGALEPASEDFLERVEAAFAEAHAAEAAAFSALLAWRGEWLVAQQADRKSGGGDAQRE